MALLTTIPLLLIQSTELKHPCTQQLQKVNCTVFPNAVVKLVRYSTAWIYLSDRSAEFNTPIAIIGPIERWYLPFRPSPLMCFAIARSIQHQMCSDPDRPLIF